MKFLPPPFIHPKIYLPELLTVCMERGIAQGYVINERTEIRKQSRPNVLKIAIYCQVLTNYGRSLREGGGPKSDFLGPRCCLLNFPERNF